MKNKEAIEYEVTSERKADKLFVVLIKVDQQAEHFGLVGTFRNAMESLRQEAVRASSIYQAAQIAAEKIEPSLKSNEKVVAIKEEHDKVHDAL